MRKQSKPAIPAFDKLNFLRFVKPSRSKEWEVPKGFRMAKVAEVTPGSKVYIQTDEGTLLSLVVVCRPTGNKGGMNIEYLPLEGYQSLLISDNVAAILDGDVEYGPQVLVKTGKRPADHETPRALWDEAFIRKSDLTKGSDVGKVKRKRVG